MNLTIKKTDKRHTGGGQWKWLVIVERRPAVPYGSPAMIQKTQDLNEIRDWCWQTYGASCELEFWLRVPEDGQKRNEKWCWHTNYDNFKIYLRTDKEVNWFKLKWL
jgi:hypothetical protein